MNKRWRTYRITFSNGMIYIGITSRRISDRMYGHRKKPSNERLYALMQDKSLTHKLEVIGEFEGEAGARQCEFENINKLSKTDADKLLNKSNRWTLDRLGNGKTVKSAVAKYQARKKYEPNYGRDYKCRHCQMIKPGTDFYKDASRSCGLASACKRCSALREWFVRQAIRAGETASVGYQNFRRDVIGIRRAEEGKTQ